MAVLAPMPRASAETAAMVKPGLLKKRCSACLTSFQKSPMDQLLNGIDGQLGSECRPEHPSAAKALTRSGALAARLKRLRKNSKHSAKPWDQDQQGLKARIDLAPFAARL